jgi:hypothetical protein
MNLFNLLQGNNQDRKKATQETNNSGFDESERNLSNQNESKQEKSQSPEIPEKVFVEYQTPKTRENESPNNGNREVNDLHFLYGFLEKNLEKKGYDDALMNPDTSYMDENIVNIRNELSLIISKTRIYYRAYLRTINFHIDTRKRNGMIETVDELLAHRESIEEELKIFTSIEEDASQGIGLCQNPILSYKKGFRNGFAAITYNTILARKP